jgi:hypothetical protein
MIVQLDRIIEAVRSTVPEFDVGEDRPEAGDACGESR